MRIGTAGWSITSEAAASFPGSGQHLQRYARVLNCTEINSSFYRPHQFKVYERWASLTPRGFRFSVKLPRTITHEGRLRRAREPLKAFLAQLGGLGDRLAVLLVQLPPSFAFEARTVRNFFSLLADLSEVPTVCEPRNATWFTPSADRVLTALEVSRAATDPAPWPQASRPGGWLGPRAAGLGAVIYHRWHGSPRMYWSRYDQQWLEGRLQEVEQWPPGGDCWCIFDNTAGGGAIMNALEMCAGQRSR